MCRCLRHGTVSFWNPSHTASTSKAKRPKALNPMFGTYEAMPACVQVCESKPQTSNPETLKTLKPQTPIINLASSPKPPKKGLQRNPKCSKIPKPYPKPETLNPKSESKASLLRAWISMWERRSPPGVVSLLGLGFFLRFGGFWGFGF